MEFTSAISFSQATNPEIRRKKKMLWTDRFNMLHGIPGKRNAHVNLIKFWFLEPAVVNSEADARFEIIFLHQPVGGGSPAAKLYADVHQREGLQDIASSYRETDSQRKGCFIERCVFELKGRSEERRVGKECRSRW